jgi:hypothetical protein
VLTISGGSASVVVPMVRTTPPKEDKAGTSSVEAPTAQPMVAQPAYKMPDDNLADDDPGLLNFNTVELQPDAGSAFLVLGHEDVKGGLWKSLRLAPFILLPMAILQTFWLDHPRWLFFSYDDLFTLGRLIMRWLNQDLLSIELDQVHVCQEWVIVEHHLGTFCKFQSSSTYGQLNLSM